SNPLRSEKIPPHHDHSERLVASELKKEGTTKTRRAQRVVTGQALSRRVGLCALRVFVVHFLCILRRYKISQTDAGQPPRGVIQTGAVCWWSVSPLAGPT